MRKKLYLTLLSLVLCIGQASAQWEKYASVTHVLIWNNDGTYTAFACKQQPEVKTDSAQIVVTLNEEAVLTFPTNEVRRFTFGKGDDTAIDAVKNGNIEIGQQTIHATELPDGTQVTVYDSNGRLMASSKSRNGQARVNISNLRRGIYVVKAGSINFKFMKR